MKTIVGKFSRSADGKPLANATLTLKLDRTAQTIIESGAELEWPEDYEKSVQLDESGAIPPGFTIRANDEIAPDGTDYELRVFDTEAESGPCPITHYRNWLELVGSETIDLNTLDPDLYPEPPPTPPPPPPPFGVPRPIKPAGFFAGSVRPPSKNVAPTPILYCAFNAGRAAIDRGLFKVQAFALSRRFTVNRVSIYIHTPSPVPGQEMVVGLYDLRSRRKLCQVGIDTSGSGPSTGVLSSPITLGVGEYACSWAPSHPCNTLRVYGVGDFNEYDPVASRLMDVGNDERVLTTGVAAGRVGRVLPEVLGDVAKENAGEKFITPLTNAVVDVTLPELPILAYFDQAQIPASRRVSQ